MTIEENKLLSAKVDQLLVQAESRLQAEARLHRRLAEAHESYAREIGALASFAEETPILELRGQVQRRLIALPEMFTERGMSVAEIARALGQDEPNTYPVLKSLTESGVAEVIAATSPKRWRMTLKHRRDRILRLSRLVPDGCWTTYGDFSIAIYGSNKMARTIGRVASKSPAFTKPQRVLWSGGEIKDDWRDDQGRGPEECEKRLREEGIAVKDRHAEKRKFIGWEKLQELLEADEEESELGAAARL